MDALTSWRALKVHRIWLAIAVLVGLIVGVVWPERAIHGKPTTIAQAISGHWGHYTASAVLGVPPLTSSAADAATRANQAGFYAQSSDVRNGTLAILRQPANSPLLARVLTLTPKPAAGLLIATGTGATPGQAAAVANAFATALQNRLATAAQQASTSRLAAAQNDVDLLKTQFTAINQEVAALPTSTTADSASVAELRGRLAATSAAYNAAYRNYIAAQNNASTGSQSLVITLQSANVAQATYVAASRSLINHRWARAPLGGLIALVVLAAGLLLNEYRRPRLRTRRATELAFGAPVIAELPRIRAATFEVAVRGAPLSRSAEAYRQLRTVLLLSPVAAPPGSGPWQPWNTKPAAVRSEVLVAQHAAANGSAQASRNGAEPDALSTGQIGEPPSIAADTIMIVCPNAEKSLAGITTNVAAAIAETGRSVVVLRAAAGAEPPFVLHGSELPLQRTDVLHVRELTFDPRTSDARTLRALLEASAARADVVLISGGSVLAEPAAAALGPFVGSVLVAAEVGETTVADAHETSQFLRRLALPLRGIVLADMPESDLVVRSAGPPASYYDRPLPSDESPTIPGFGPRSEPVNPPSTTAAARTTAADSTEVVAPSDPETARSPDLDKAVFAVWTDDKLDPEVDEPESEPVSAPSPKQESAAQQPEAQSPEPPATLPPETPVDASNAEFVDVGAVEPGGLRRSTPVAELRASTPVVTMRLPDIAESPAPSRVLSAAVELPAAPPAGTLYRRRLGARRVLRDLWATREIIRTLAERDVRVRYKQASLGFAWALLTPLGLLVAFVVLFHRAAHVGTNGVPYDLFAYLGLIPWTFFSTVVSSGGSSLLSEKGLMSKTYFPREVFPFSAAVVALFDAAAGLVPLAVLYVVHRRLPGITILWAPIPLLVLAMFAMGVALAVSAVIVYYRDVRLGLPLLLQMGLFLTPVGYGISVVPSSLRIPYALVDPVAPVIQSLRDVMLFGHAPHWTSLGLGALSASLVLTAGWMLFKRLETGFADVA